MPPARSIFIDTNHILRSIAEQASEQREDAIRRTENLMHREQLLQEALEDAQWVARDLVALTGRALTASERIRAQQAVRRMEADGLIQLDMRHVRLTDAGREALANDG
jgi:hypothetical protein